MTISTKTLTAITAKAAAIGVAILEHKPSAYVADDFHIVLAYKPKGGYNYGEFVTWLWANGAFHNGHYYTDDFKSAKQDFAERNEN